MTSGTEAKPHRLRFLKEISRVPPGVTSNDGLNRPDGEQWRSKPMRVLPDVGGYSTVFLPGCSSFIVKTATSSPHLIRLRGQFVRGMSSFDDKSSCEHGFVYVDSTVISY